MLIIFTITNKVTDQVFVGSTRNSLESQWVKIVSASEQGLDYPLYKQICRYGVDQFEVEEWDYAETRGELLALEQEAVDSLGAESLRGYKTAVTQKRAPAAVTKKRKASTSKPKPSASEVEQPTKDSSSPEVDTDSLAAVPKKQEITQPPKPAEAAQKPVSILAQLTANARAYTKSKAVEAAKTANTRPSTPETSETTTTETISTSIGSGQEEVDPLDSLLAKVNAYSTQAKATQDLPAAENREICVDHSDPVTNEHQQRILAAINKQRQLRSERTPTVIEQERKQLADLLTKLEYRATELQQPAGLI